MLILHSEVTLGDWGQNSRVCLKSTKSGRSVRLFVDLNFRMQLEIARPTRVDVDFRMQFEMARPSREYSALLKLPPNIYVGRGDRLQCIVKMLCECMKNSLKKTGMHIPPWGKFK